MEKKLSYYVFLRIMEVVEVTQEINSTGIIPLEALRTQTNKKASQNTVLYLGSKGPKSIVLHQQPV